MARTIPPGGAAARATGCLADDRSCCFREWWQLRTLQALLVYPGWLQSKHSENIQGWRVLRIAMRLHQDFNILIERHEKAQQALHGKLPELATQHLGDIRLADSEETGRLDLF